jgi:putative Holliday junction resolvase
MRVMAVDHGERRIGIAISDTTGTIARPLAIVKHVARLADAGQVAELARQNEVGVIVVGESTDEAGLLNAAGRRARRFAEALGTQTAIPVVMWDESLSSQDARAARIAAGASRRKRAEEIDSAAAAAILQTYLDAHPAMDGSGRRL